MVNNELILESHSMSTYSKLSIMVFQWVIIKKIYLSFLPFIIILLWYNTWPKCVYAHFSSLLILCSYILIPHTKVCIINISQFLCCPLPYFQRCIEQFTICLNCFNWFPNIHKYSHSYKIHSVPVHLRNIVNIF